MHSPLLCSKLHSLPLFRSARRLQRLNTAVLPCRPMVISIRSMRRRSLFVRWCSYRRRGRCHCRCRSRSMPLFMRFMMACSSRRWDGLGWEAELQAQRYGSCVNPQLHAYNVLCSPFLHTYAYTCMYIHTFKYLHWCVLYAYVLAGFVFMRMGVAYA